MSGKSDATSLCSRPLHKLQKRLFGGMQIPTAVRYELIECVEVVIDDLAALKIVDDVRRNVGATTDSRRVAESLSCFLDRRDNFSFAITVLLD